MYHKNPNTSWAITVQKHRKREAGNLSVDVLVSHYDGLRKFLVQPWMESGIYKAMKGIVSQLSDSLCKYATYLKRKNDEVQENHASQQPIRSEYETESVTDISSIKWVKLTVAARFQGRSATVDLW